MKKILLIIGLALSILVGQAAQVTSVLGAGTRTTNAITSGGALTSLTIVNTNAATLCTLVLIDSSNTNQLYTITAYTNRVASKVSVTNIYNDINGVSTTNISDALSYTDNTVAASTNNLPRVLTLTVPAATTYTYTPATPLFFGRGILYTNDASCTVTATYSSVK